MQYRGGAAPGVVIGSDHFIAAHRFLDPEEEVTVINGYEHRHWTTVIRWVLSRFLGWRYRSSTSDRRRLVGQLPLIASVRRLVRPDDHFQKGWMPEPQLATGGNLALGPGRPDEMSTGHRHGNTKNNDPSLIERIAQAY